MARESCMCLVYCIDKTLMGHRLQGHEGYLSGSRSLQLLVFKRTGEVHNDDSLSYWGVQFGCEAQDHVQGSRGFHYTRL